MRCKAACRFGANWSIALAILSPFIQQSACDSTINWIEWNLYTRYSLPFRPLIAFKWCKLQEKVNSGHYHLFKSKLKFDPHKRVFLNYDCTDNYTPCNGGFFMESGFFINSLWKWKKVDSFYLGNKELLLCNKPKLWEWYHVSLFQWMTFCEVIGVVSWAL